MHYVMYGKSSTAVTNTQILKVYLFFIYLFNFFYRIFFHKRLDLGKKMVIASLNILYISKLKKLKLTFLSKNQVGEFWGKKSLIWEILRTVRGKLLLLIWQRWLNRNFEKLLQILKEKFNLPWQDPACFTSNNTPCLHASCIIWHQVW